MQRVPKKCTFHEKLRPLQANFSYFCAGVVYPLTDDLLMNDPVGLKRIDRGDADVVVLG